MYQTSSRRRGTTAGSANTGSGASTTDDCPTCCACRCADRRARGGIVSRTFHRISRMITGGDIFFGSTHALVDSLFGRRAADALELLIGIEHGPLRRTARVNQQHKDQYTHTHHKNLLTRKNSDSQSRRYDLDESLLDAIAQSLEALRKAMLRL